MIKIHSLLSIFCCFFHLLQGQTSTDLLYFSNQSGVYQLYESDIMGNNATLLINQPDYNYWWIYTHPQNTKFITYRSHKSTSKDQGDYENAELWLHDIDGSNPILLIDTSTYHWKAHGVAKFSPDGKKLLMAVTPPPPNPSWWYGFVTDSVGKNPQQISNWWMVDPAWSPDGSKIVFCGFPNNIPNTDLTQLELFVADFNHITNTLSTPIQITTGTGRVHDPCFSHQGDRVTFSDGNLLYSDVDIKIVDTNGNNPITLVDDNGANGGSVFWTCDDSEIWFHNLTLFVNNFQIRKVNVSTKTVTTILQNINYAYTSPHIYCDITLSVKEYYEMPFTVYPNPFYTETTIHTDLYLKNASIAIYDAQGQIIQHLKNVSGQNIIFSREHLAAGLYFLHLTEVDNLISIQKLVISN